MSREVYIGVDLGTSGVKAAGIRLGHMGPGAEDANVLSTLNAMEASARKLGLSSRPGCAIEAALK
jgi:aspartate aminotransferase-like enzyme